MESDPEKKSVRDSSPLLHNDAKQNSRVQDWSLQVTHVYSSDRWRQQKVNPLSAEKGK